MRLSEIHDHLRARPFEPLRVYLSDGSWYDIPHPEFAFLTSRKLVIGLERRGSSVPSSSVTCDLLHITRIEPVVLDED